VTDANQKTATEAPPGSRLVQSTLQAAIADLRDKVGEAAASEFRGQTRVVVHAAAAHPALARLRDAHGFDMLADLTCVDYLHYAGPREKGDRSNLPERPSGCSAQIGPVPFFPKDRYGLVYLLANTQTNERITVRVMLNDPEPAIASVTDLWEAANWAEREVWDMFGIRFTGHPDLRRILLPEGFTAFPLRKDYPMQGRGERHNFPVLRRAES
jgi:NADH-quinone oxidoreductase subunit C